MDLKINARSVQVGACMHKDWALRELFGRERASDFARIGLFCSLFVFSFPIVRVCSTSLPTTHVDVAAPCITTDYP